VCSSDHARR